MGTMLRESDDFRGVRTLPASRSSSELSAHQMAGKNCALAGSSRNRTHGDFPSVKELAELPYGWRFKTSSSVLDFFVVLTCPPFFGLPIYGLISDVYFGYVVTGRYVLSIEATVVASRKNPS